MPPSSLVPTPDPQSPTPTQPPTPNHRSGISLLEVLISIFVLAVGLLGVAAMIPAARYQIGQGSRLDYASMVGRAALRDMKVRGHLTLEGPNGRNWVETTGNNKQWDSASRTFNIFNSMTFGSNQVAVAIDPLGIDAGSSVQFPHNAPTAQPFLTRVFPFDFGGPASAVQVPFFDVVFRPAVDLLVQENPNDALPPLQTYLGNQRRASQGDYSWMATVVSDPAKNAATSEVTVSVVVFFKRDLSTAGAGERIAGVFDPTKLPTGTFRLTLLTTPVKPGQWIMISGRRLVTLEPYFAWYRVVSAAPLNTVSGEQDITVAGRAWDPRVTVTPAVFIVDHVVAVYEKNMHLDLQ